MAPSADSLGSLNRCSPSAIALGVPATRLDGSRGGGGGHGPWRAMAPTRRLAEPDGGAACAYPRYRETLPGGRGYDVLDQVEGGAADRFGPLVVPDGYLFVMGDNRDDSFDSRFPVAAGGVGLLPVDNVVGRATIAFWSTDGSAEWVEPWTWFSAARWGRIGRTW